MKFLPVIETFSSIQGESTHAGRRCFFIRLAGCNLRCNYCDTAYAWQGGKMQCADELCAAAVDSGMDCVEITGGEPLLHENTPRLAQALLDAGMEVLVETNGSLNIDLLPPGCCRIVDWKLPGSGEAASFDMGNIERLTGRDEVKFVISGAEDFAYATEMISRHRLYEKTPHLIFSPVWNRISFEELARLVVAAQLPVRMQLQMHKLIWGDKKGV